jgi:hypothetical protein
MMRLEILHVPDCPGAALLETRLAPLLAARPDVELTRQLVTTQPDAGRLGMTGSPTLLADGADPFTRPGLRPSISCRLYPDDTAARAPPPRPPSSATPSETLANRRATRSRRGRTAAARRGWLLVSTCRTRPTRISWSRRRIPQHGAPPKSGPAASQGCHQKSLKIRYYDQFYRLLNKVTERDHGRWCDYAPGPPGETIVP